MSKMKIFLNGLLDENPSLVIFLGMCPLLAKSDNISSAVGMSLAVFIILLFSNIIVSLIRKHVPNEIRIPVYIIIIASLVSSMHLLMKAYTPAIEANLGAFIPLIVVNCIILGRAEAFASKNNVLDSIIDACGMAAGFFVAIFTLAFIRQLFGTGSLSFVNPFNDSELFFWNFFGKDGMTNKAGTLVDPIFGGNYSIKTLVSSPGAFLILGLMVAAVTAMKTNAAAKAKAKALREKEAN